MKTYLKVTDDDYHAAGIPKDEPKPIETYQVFSNAKKPLLNARKPLDLRPVEQASKDEPEDWRIV